MSTEKQNEITGEVLVLPLWKGCLEQMLRDGVEYGKTYESTFFEQSLRCGRDTMQFGLGISEIRRALEAKGFYLSGRGQKGDQFIILPPEGNRKILEAYQRAAFDAMKRGVILGTNTRLDSLSVEDRRKHEAVLEKMAFRTVLMQRSQSIKKVVEKHSPKLLK